jgi:DNA-binding transcriptional MerR regulator
VLSISQLAGYACVTVKAVRHYHRIGLLPEPARSVSGYREYDAAAVVLLIRIRVLADAGVPLARVAQLLAADEAEFSDAVVQIDQRLNSEIDRLHALRSRLSRLTAGDNLALPSTIVAYLDRLRSLGIDDRIIGLERDGWIMIAAQVPGEIEEMLTQKHAELEDPDMVQLYRMLGDAMDWRSDDPRAADIADLLERLMHSAIASGTAEADDGLSDGFVELLDASTLASAPIAPAVLAILNDRGWQGWTRIQPLASSTPIDPSPPEELR